MVRHATFFMLVITAVALAPRRVCAQQSVTLQWENDVLFRSDDDYTNGLRVSADLDKALWWKRWGLGYNNCRDEDKSKPCLRTTLMFGQNFYTPQDITIEEVQENERPYAAWLYVGFAARVARPTRLTSVELQVGTTGKKAFGEEVQSWFHSHLTRHSPQPRGWAHQVKPVPGLVGIVASWDDKFAREKTTAGRHLVYADAIPYYRVTVGNVHTNAAVGTTVRFGYNIQRNWTEKITPTFHVASTTPARPPDKPRGFANVFAGLEARAIAWNALLQHDTYTPRRLPSIARSVADLEAGFQAGYGWLSGGLRYVWRSPEFDGGRVSRFNGLFITFGTPGS